MAFAAILQHGFSSPTKLPPSPPDPASHLGRPSPGSARSQTALVRWNPTLAYPDTTPRLSKRR